MNHRLFIAKEVVAETAIPFESLADAGDVAVAKNSEAAFEEAMLHSVAFDKLVLQKGDDSLRNSEASCHRKLSYQSIASTSSRIIRGLAVSEDPWPSTSNESMCAAGLLLRPMSALSRRES